MGEEKREISTTSFPSNSHKARTEATTKVEAKKEERTKVQKVVKGVVVQKKKSLGRRFTDTFIGEDIDDVWGYIIHDVLVPAAKNTVTDMVQGGIEMLLFGEKKGTRTSRDRGRSYVSYNSMSSRDRDRKDDRRDRDRSSGNRARHNFDDIILETRGEAEEVLSCLADLCSDYGQASVADLYDLVGITGNFTDNKYGWIDVGGASASRARSGGYMLNLPKPVLLD